ncbi:MAG: bifunctional demethylmenaquinone methyltransferase/2-methoxy-6-polyprenyl-1,4-benzoquinol methylase UbiE [Bacteroidota bacterium]
MAEHIKPYNKDEDKKGQVSKMFDNIAPYYDFLNRFLSLGIDTIWRKKAINELVSVKPQHVLDVATGTGDVAIEIAKRLQPEKIIGLDISKEMLEIGKKKIAKKEMSDIIQMEVGDSENLRFENNTFDAITVAFGVRNFENLEKGISEINRVLKKDGKLIVLEFSKPTVFPFKQLFNFYFKYILPLIGRFTSNDKRAYSYLYESVQAFPEGDNFIKVLEKTGFKSNTCKRLSLGICSIYTGIK